MTEFDWHDDQCPEPSSMVGQLADGQFYRREGARLQGSMDCMGSGYDFTDDHYRAFHAFDTAHLLMLLETELIPRTAGVDMLTELQRLEVSAEHVSTRKRLGYGPHSGEAHLIATLGEEIGGWIHLGRSSRDLREAAIRIVVRERLLDLHAECSKLCETYVSLAESHARNVIPTYTRGQHAQVTTVGHVLLSWERPIERVLTRIQECFARVNRSPAGAVAGTATGFAIDRNLTAQLLGFERPITNTSDSVHSADVAVEVQFLAATALEPVVSAVQHLLSWNAPEFGFVSFADRHCGTSSVMPQKKNPVAVFEILRRFEKVIAAVTASLSTASSSHRRPIIDVLPIDKAIEAISLGTDVLSAVSFDFDKTREHVFEEWALATSLAEYLVHSEDIPWRSAHQICAILCRRCIAMETPITDLQLKMVASVAEAYLNRAVSLDSAGFKAALDPDTVVTNASSVMGSPAPDEIASQVRSSDTFLETMNTWEREERRRIDAAHRARSRKSSIVLESTREHHG